MSLGVLCCLSSSLTRAHNMNILARPGCWTGRADERHCAAWPSQGRGVHETPTAARGPGNTNAAPTNWDLEASQLPAWTNWDGGSGGRRTDAPRTDLASGAARALYAAASAGELAETWQAVRGDPEARTPAMILVAAQRLAHFSGASQSAECASLPPATVAALCGGAAAPSAAAVTAAAPTPDSAGNRHSASGADPSGSSDSTPDGSSTSISGSNSAPDSSIGGRFDSPSGITGSSLACSSGGSSMSDAAASQGGPTTGSRAAPRASMPRGAWTAPDNEGAMGDENAALALVPSVAAAVLQQLPELSLEQAGGAVHALAATPASAARLPPGFAVDFAEGLAAESDAFRDGDTEV